MVNEQRPAVVLHPPATLGVIGGGQLGRMFLQAAQRMGYRTVVLSPTADAPGAQVAHDAIVAPPDNLPALRSLAERADAVTVEFENVSAPALRWLARRRAGASRLADRLGQSEPIAGKGFSRRDKGSRSPPGGRYGRMGNLTAAVEALGCPLVLKTAASGYDGKGQVRVEDAADIEGAWSSLGRVACVAEGWVQFEAEVSVVVARGTDGEAVTYPVGLNRHERHILDSTVMPAPVGPSVAIDARSLALKVAEALGTVGVLTVEFFLTPAGDLLINELGPTSS